jgi:uncharacterized RDD family membrane protein YckC
MFTVATNQAFRASDSVTRRATGVAIEIFGRTITIAGAVTTLVVILSGSGFRALFILFICVLGLKLQLWGRRYSRRSAESVLARDQRPPVVYLRPFNSDMETTTFGEADSLSNIIIGHFIGNFWEWRRWQRYPKLVYVIPRLILSAPRTEEEELAYALNWIGPTIAVANPAEILPPAGIPRLRLDPENWQAEVRSLLRRAQLVVVRCGSSRISSDGYWPTDRSEGVSGGIGWELSAAISEVHPDKLILLSPFDAADYETFCYKTKSVFPKGLPAVAECEPQSGTIRNVIWFDSDWNATSTPITGIQTGARLDTLHPLGKSLKQTIAAIAGIAASRGERAGLLAKRGLATLIDYYLTASAVVGIRLFIAPAFFDVLSPSVTKRMMWIFLFLWLILSLLYESILVSSNLQATYGKCFFGLVVTDSAISPLGFTSAIKRSVVKLLLLPFSWLHLLTGSGRLLHDVLTNTQVTDRYLRRIDPARWLSVAGWILWLPTFLVSAGVFTLIAPLLPDVKAILHRPLEFPSGVSEVNLKCIEVNGLLLMPITIKGQELWFLLSSMTVETFLDTKVADALYLEPGFGRRLDSATETAIVYRDGSTLELGSAKLEVRRFVPFDFTVTGRLLHHQVDGAIGYELLRNAVVSLDYSQQTVRIINANINIIRAGTDNVPISLRDGWPYVGAVAEIRGCTQAETSYLVNTVAPYSLAYEECSPRTNDPLGAGQNKGPIGEQVDVIRIGSTVINDLGPGCCLRTFDGRPQLGAGLLRRFIITFDYPHSRLLIEHR